MAQYIIEIKTSGSASFNLSYVLKELSEHIEKEGLALNKKIEIDDPMECMWDFFDPIDSTEVKIKKLKKNKRVRKCK